ncbi:unnamed protein product [Brassicogethes aeneus]|uniref:RING-type domain-containing protein n=1 Tax=Brassicogethes aeneus TaxID=1431903 RepID=A0A9P0FLS6_BRAAE|nr:unnamed protein product [Brassicogethes aeneus]
MGKEDNKNQNLFTLGAVAVAATVTGIATWFFTKKSQNCYEHTNSSPSGSRNNFQAGPSVGNSRNSTNDCKCLRTEKFKEECAICLEDFETRELSCGHVFHTKCISKWLQYNNTCPFCRKENP